MPKKKRKPFNNPKLDKMQKPLKPASLLSANKTLARREMQSAIVQLGVMQTLIKHYKISNEDPDKWFLLALNLAHDYVPAMKFQKKRGKKKQWDFLDNIALHSLIELHKKQSPQKKIFSEKRGGSICQEVPTLAKDTKLFDLVKDLSPSSIEKRYQDFKQTEEFCLFKKISHDVKSIEDLAALTIYSPDYKLETATPKKKLAH